MFKRSGKTNYFTFSKTKLFVKQGTFLNKDHYLFNDKERFHKNKRKYKLYIPDVPGLKKLFNTKIFLILKLVRGITTIVVSKENTTL